MRIVSDENRQGGAAHFRAVCSQCGAYGQWGPGTKCTGSKGCRWRLELQGCTEVRLWDRHACPAGAHESKQDVHGRQTVVHGRPHEGLSCNWPAPPPPQLPKSMTRAELLQDKGGDHATDRLRWGKPGSGLQRVCQMNADGASRGLEVTA